MEWQLTDIKSLTIIDQEIGENKFAPAEYEILRQVIYETADFDYQSLISFSQTSLQSGAAALAARTTIVVDIPMVQVGIISHLQKTFSNPVYCSLETITRPQKGKTQSAWGMYTLAKRYPEAIFVVGKDQFALKVLVELIEAEKIKPALVIGTPSGFIGADIIKQRLQDSMTPNICIHGRKGNAVVAVAILNALIDLAWQAYGQEVNIL